MGWLRACPAKPSNIDVWKVSCSFSYFMIIAHSAQCKQGRILSSLGHEAETKKQDF
jgi:hypothetical protein